MTLRDAILFRFSQEVDRLQEQRHIKNMPDLARELGLPLTKVQDAKRGKAISYELLVAFVRRFRGAGVSYEYLLEGRNKPKGSNNLDQARRFLDGDG
jgi:hypothetical protein